MNKSYNFFKSIKKYKYHLIKIIYFELLFIIKGYGILKLDKSKNRDFTDNIPCPYYFLDKIAKEKRVNFKNFDFFYDLGCGYGRVINFFRKKFSNLNIIGIEYDKNYSDYCCKKFFRYSNVKIINDDFKNVDLKLNNSVIFLNDPFANKEDFLSFIKLKAQKNISNTIFISVNTNIEVLMKIKNIKILVSFLIEDKGFVIFEI